MNALIVGASSGLGRAMALRFAEAGYDVVLVARDATDLMATAQDVSIRFGVKAIAVVADVLDAGWIDEVAQATGSVGLMDVLAMPIGAVADNDDPSLDRGGVEQLMRINFIAVTECVQRFWPEIQERKGVIIGFGSIAAARGRTGNAAYAAAKRALHGWFQSLRHFAVNRGVCVQYYVPGYLNTALAYGMSLKFPKGDPDAFARLIVRDLGKDFGVRYYPFFWRYLCTALQFIPWHIYSRLHF
jgi:decaprenylphospho-beta-D-erythro-pentofuranosid-2-ulose 2-reductase